MSPEPHSPCTPAGLSAPALLALRRVPVHKQGLSPPGVPPSCPEPCAGWQDKQQCPGVTLGRAEWENSHPWYPHPAHHAQGRFGARIYFSTALVSDGMSGQGVLFFFPFPSVQMGGSITQQCQGGGHGAGPTQILPQPFPALFSCLWGGSTWSLPQKQGLEPDAPGNEASPTQLAEMEGLWLPGKRWDWISNIPSFSGKRQEIH